MSYQDWQLELGQRTATYLALSETGRQYFGQRNDGQIVWQDNLKENE